MATGMDHFHQDSGNQEHVSLRNLLGLGFSGQNLPRFSDFFFCDVREGTERVGNEKTS